MAKEPILVQVDIDRFIDDLWKLADGEYEFDQVQIMEDMVREGFINTYDGCLGVISEFSNFDVVRKDEFERKFPKYAKVMTWDEFRYNEGFYSNDKYAVLEDRQ